MEDHITQLKPDMIVQGPMLPEPVKIAMFQEIGETVKLIGQGLSSGKFYAPSLTPALVLLNGSILSS